MRDRYLFLDIDGVLNNTPQVPQVWGRAPNMAHLHSILTACPGTKVVVTSYWRGIKTPDEWSAWLQWDEDWVAPHVVGVTGNGTHRAAEIEAFMTTMCGDVRPDEIVVLDDLDIGCGPTLDLRSRLVRTDGRQGLSFGDAVRVICLLKGYDQ